MAQHHINGDNDTINDYITTQPHNHRGHLGMAKGRHMGRQGGEQKSEEGEAGPVRQNDDETTCSVEGGEGRGGVRGLPERHQATKQQPNRQPKRHWVLWKVLRDWLPTAADKGMPTLMHNNAKIM